MKTNIFNTLDSIKSALVATLTHTMAMSVILAHAHAGDVVRQSSPDFYQPSKISSDVSAKVIGDLHNHIDKTMLKNAVKSPSDTTSAVSRRELRNAVVQIEESVLERVEMQMLLLRAFLTMRV